PGQQRAIDEFVERYYTAIRAYISAIVRNTSMAEELTQEFFTNAVLSGRLLVQAHRDKGSFRAYLKQAIRNFLIDQHRRRARRHEDAPGAADGAPCTWEVVADDSAEGPDAELLRAWGQSVVRVALAKVQEMSRERGQDVHFELFARRFLTDSDDPPRWKE